MRVWGWRLAVAGFGLAVLVLPVALAVRFAATSGWWWERGFDQFHAETRTGLPRDAVDQGAADLRAYFASDADLPAITVINTAGAEESLFTEREARHLRDVRLLFDRTYDAGWAALGYGITFVVALGFLAGARRRVLLGRALRYAGGGGFAAIGGLAVVAVTGFDGVFRQFHLLFFTNDLWQLSSRDRLIQMFPQDFFFETTLLVGGVALLATGTALWLGWRLGRTVAPPDLVWQAARGGPSPAPPRAGEG